jgi:hypothetical protein
LAEQAKVLVTEAEENKLGAKVMNDRLNRWHTCSLCEKRYYGVVRCALGWACWKTYVGRPEGHWAQNVAMTVLALGVGAGQRHQEQIEILESQLAGQLRRGDRERDVLITRTNIALALNNQGRCEEALALRREIYDRSVELGFPRDEPFFTDVLNLGFSLIDTGGHTEAKSFLREQLPKARCALGAENDTMIRLRWAYAQALYSDKHASRADAAEAVAILEELSGIARKIYGTHPLTLGIQENLDAARLKLTIPRTVIQFENSLKLNESDSVT